MKRILFFLLIGISASCDGGIMDPEATDAENLKSEVLATTVPAVVEVVQENGVWKLKRDGQDYIVKGVAAGKSTYPDADYDDEFNTSV